MATNKTTAQTASKQRRRDNPSVTVRIDRMIDMRESQIKAFASAYLGEGFAVHGIKVVNSKNGLFVQMPQNRYYRDGKTVFEDIFHPTTPDARSELYGAVLSAYGQRLHMREDESQETVDEPDEEESEDEEPAFEQRM